jgi:AraC-like DNA-binding protein
VKLAVVERETPAGRSSFVSWRAPSQSAWIQQVWYALGALEHLRELVIPDGGIELVVNLGSPIRVAEGRGTEMLRTACTSGLQLGQSVLAHPSRHDAIGVRLHPLGARALFGRSLKSLTNHFAALDEIIGRAASELVERCHAAPTVPARMAVARAWVEQRLRGATFDPALLFTVRQIEAARGALSLKELHARTGWGKTRWIEHFREALGVTPKQYARVHRFAHAVKLLDGRARSFAEVALAAGYYDQPHMNGEFQHLGGMTPRQLIARSADGLALPDMSEADADFFPRSPLSDRDRWWG